MSLSAPLAADEAAPAATPAAPAPASPAASETPAAPIPAPVAAEAPAVAPSSAKADPLAALSPELRALLEKVARAGDKHRHITAEVTYVEEELVFGERNVYRGKVFYRRPAEKDASGAFRIHFDKLTAGGRSSEEDRDYVLFGDDKGQWFVTRNAKIKQIVKYHVARPGERSDPMELGRGPFPVPFGQDPRRVAEMFELSLREPRASDPQDAACVVLIPREQTAKELRISRVEMWIDPRGLPVKIRVDDLDGEVRKTASFRRLDVETKIADSVFELPWPSAASGWERRIEPLPEPKPAP